MLAVVAYHWAVSRGMSHAVLVEQDRKAQAIIAENSNDQGVSISAIKDGSEERALEQINESWPWSF